MPFLSIPECAEAITHITIDGQDTVNVFGFHKTGGYTQADIDNLAADVDAAMGSTGKAIRHVGCTYVETVVRGLQNIVDLTSVNNTNAGAGTGAAGAVPNNAAFCITLRTGHTGRSARGRVYIAGIGDTDFTSANTVKTAYATAAEAYVSDVLATAAVDGWDLSVLSRRTAGSARLLGVFFKVTTVVARNLLIDSQRGRLPRGH